MNRRGRPQVSLIATLAVVAGCGGMTAHPVALKAHGTAPHSTTTSSTPVTTSSMTTTTTTPAPSTTTTTRRACSAADLADPGPAPMPAAARLAQPESFPAAGVSLTRPGASDDPVASPATAWTNAAIDKRRDATYRIVLARLSATDPATIGSDGSQTPLYNDVLAWVVLSYGVPEVSTGGAPAPGGAATSTAVACYFADGVAATDARNGRAMFSTDFGPGA